MSTKAACCLECCYEMLCEIWYHLYNLKNLKNTHGGLLLFVKLQAEKVKLLHWCFSRFLNCTSGIKSRKAFHIEHKVNPWERKKEVSQRTTVKTWRQQPSHHKRTTKCQQISNVPVSSPLILNVYFRSLAVDPVVCLIVLLYVFAKMWELL